MNNEWSKLDLYSDEQLKKYLLDGVPYTRDFSYSYEQIKEELERRKNKRAETARDEITKGTFQRIDKALNLFENVVKKPKTALIIAGLFAIAVPVIVNILTAWLEKSLNLK